ncbi:MAG TPA: Crp/Fnr family transcriptional regulator [Epsilonproteobacteria bacterium]|nr:Crp/Fnr family transcriptional regulator [Campylobacterota bacterium]
MLELKDIPLFSRLSTEQLEQLQGEMLIHQYEKESIVFYEGDESEYLHILLDGIVRLYKTSPKGTQVHMHNFAAPEIIALFAAFEQIPFPATCEFLGEGTVGLLPLSKIYDCMKKVDFSISLVSALSKRMKLLANLLHKETIYSTEAKIADIILNNPSVFERLKNNEIASILNMTPETLSRILSKLKKEEIITIKEHVVKILNEDALHHIIETNCIKS